MMILKKKNKIPIKFSDNISKTLHKKYIKVMSHRDIGNKLLILSLLTNINCSFLYKGNNEIDKQRELYPSKSSDIKNKFFFVLKVNDTDLPRTLFLNIKIKNPKSEKRVVEVFSDKVEQKLGKEGWQKERDILTLSVDYVKGQITKDFIEKEIIKIKQAIVNHQSEKIFDNVIVNVIYDGGMRILAQTIIKKLTNGNAYEICFNPDEANLSMEDGLEKELEKYKNSNVSILKTVEESSGQDNFEVKDIDGVKQKIDDVAGQIIQRVFTKS